MKIKQVLFCLLLLCACVKASADHCAGGELLYRWVSDSTYEFTFKFYRDCSGIGADPSVLMCARDSCSGLPVRVIPLVMSPTLPDGTPNGSQIYTGCGGYPSTCVLPTSTLPGYQEYWYTGVYKLPALCEHWIFSVAIAARNFSNNLFGAEMFFVESRLNSRLAPHNSSPVFTVKPVPYVCINNPYTFNNGVQDQDGDSLVYQLVRPLAGYCGSVATPVPYAMPGFNTTNNPIPCNNTFVLNPANGQMSFTSSATGASTLTLKVLEYRNGNLIGSTMRDVQVRTMALCSPAQPTIGIDTMGIQGAVLSSGRLEHCAGRPMSFCFSASATDTTSVLIARDNAAQVTPGASLVYSGQYSNIIKGCFSWTPGLSDTGMRSLAVTVKDSTCRPPGIAVAQTYVFPVYIYPATTILKDTTVCAGTPVPLNVQGGSIFNWSVLPGGSPLSSLSCTACRTPVATPAVTTRYVVTSDLISFCNTNTDTVTVTVVPVPVAPVLTTNSPVCVGDTLRISTVPDSSLVYTWAGPGGFSQNGGTVVTRLNAQSNQSGTYTLLARRGNCAAPSAAVNVLVAEVPALPVITGDTQLCYGEALELTAGSSPGVSYQWSGPGGFNAVTAGIRINGMTPAQNGTYTVLAGYGSAYRCATVPVRVQVTVNPSFTAGLQVSRDTLCAYETLTAWSTGTSRSSISYRFDFGPGGEVLSGSGEGPYTVRYRYGGISRLILRVSEQGCPDSAERDIHVTDIPSSSFHVQPEACMGEAIWLNSEEQVSYDDACNWDFAGASILDGSGKGPYNISYSTPGRKVIRLTTSDGRCTSVETTDTIDVHPQPEAQIVQASSTGICAGDKVIFTAREQPGNYRYLWTPAAYFPEEGPEVTGTVAASGYVRLQVRDSLGCHATDSIALNTRPCCEIFLPDAFTPNGDGKNDVFKIVTTGNPLMMDLRVVNRWGQTVFTSGAKDRGWDGTYNGKPADADTYFYQVHYRCTDGRYFDQKGNVILLR